MKNSIRNWFVCALSLITAQPAWGQSKVFLDPHNRSISEYFYSRTGNELLVPVRILGGVELPGIYHLPKETDLSTLLALSGGALPDSDVQKMKFTRFGAPTQEISLHDHVAKGQEIKLAGGDIVYIPKKEGWIDNETATTLTVIVSILSLGLTAYVVARTVD